MKKTKSLTRVGGLCPICRKENCLSIAGVYGTVGCSKKKAKKLKLWTRIYY